MLGLKLMHVGINTENEEEAMKMANLIGSLLNMKVAPGNSSIFVGNKEFEIMKKPGRGTNGHIAIGCNNVDRAIYHLSQRGVKFDLDSKVVKNGKTIACYFADEIAGFVINPLYRDFPGANLHNAAVSLNQQFSFFAEPDGLSGDFPPAADDADLAVEGNAQLLVRRDKIGGQISNKPVIASLEFFQHRPDQSGPVYFLSGFQQQGGRLLFELPFKFRKIGVDADTNYYVMNLFHISSQLGQNSAYLLSADYNIVRPLNHGAAAGETADRPAHR